MTHQRRSIIAVIIGLTLAFNLERLDFGQPNLINIPTFVYVIGFLAVVSIVTIRALWRAPFPVPLALYLGLYLVGKLLNAHSHPLMGGIYTFLSVTEIGLLSILVWSAHDLGRSLHDFEEAVKNITFSDTSHRVRPLNEAADDVQLELIRGRRHQRPLSVIVVKAKRQSIQAALHRTVEEVQRMMMTRYVVTSLARVIGGQLRRMDLVLEQGAQGHFVILSPETNLESATVVAERIQAAATQQLGVSVSYGIAAFPEDALTFDELVRRAELTVHEPAELPQFLSSVPAPAESTT